MRHGRRRVLSLAAAPCSLSWLLTTVATSVRMMCITAFLGGFCCSILTMLSQVSFDGILILKMFSYLHAKHNRCGNGYVDGRLDKITHCGQISKEVHHHVILSIPSIILSIPICKFVYSIPSVRLSIPTCQFVYYI